MDPAGMDPERYSRLAELFRAAVEMSPEQQGLFLGRASGNDPELLGILQNLLAEDRQGSILPSPETGELPISGNHAPDLTGLVLSHYRINHPIAEGGMATVYSATDTQLERTVALKFLPPHVIGDAASRERFWREARSIASIDHPNVCTVYGIEETGGFLFIAMAYLQGTPLDRKIASGALPVEEALEITIQAARGLEAAHSNGIVHRDIKPANLMLIGTGSDRPSARILDFGIAQWHGKTALTGHGLTIGTVSYMAPEQIDQPQVDARADIWSLGVVLYEMLSGRPLFDRGSMREILAAIASPAPVDLTSISSAVSPDLIVILEKMLRKDPAGRYRTAGELIADLENLARGIRTGGVAAGLRHRLTRAAALLAFTATIGVAVWTLQSNNAPTGTGAPRAIPFTFYPGYEQNPSISPDGRQIAFVGQGIRGTNPLEVYTQMIGSTDPLRLTRNQPGQDDHYPVWDPAGTRLAFLRSRTAARFADVRLVPALGGIETDLGVDKVLATGRLAWNPNGRSLAFTRLPTSDQGAIYEFSLDDRTMRQRSFPGEGQSDCCPEFDPDGRRLAFKRNEVEIVVVDERTGSARALPARVSWPGLTWSGDGRSLIYSWFGRMTEVDLSGTPVQRRAAEFASDIMDITVRGHSMACVRWDFEHSIWTLDLRRAARPGITAARKAQLIASTSWDDSPQFSPDGNWIAFASKRSGSPQIWVGSRDGISLRRVTYFETESAGTPRWSPDGKWIAFDVRPPSSKPDIYVIRAAGGSSRRLTSKAGGADVPSWSRDGRWIYYHSRSDDQIWKIPAGGGGDLQVTHEGGFEAFESVDGKHLLYSRSDGKAGLWRLDLASNREEPIPGLSGAGEYRHWAPAPGGIYFVPNAEAESSQATIRFFDFSTHKTIRVCQVGRLTTAGPGTLTISPDESKLLYVPVGRDNRDIMLVENFR